MHLEVTSTFQCQFTAFSKIALGDTIQQLWVFLPTLLSAMVHLLLD